jgi:inosose dehydratase
LTIKLASSPCSWGIDFADAPTNPPWRHVLDEISQAGVPATELGPVGYLPEDPDVLAALLAERNLESAGSFLFDDFHDPTAQDRLVSLIHRTSAWVAASGGTIISLIDKPDDTRVATAGRSDAAPRLDDRRWAAFIEQFEAVADVARSYGVHPVVHPHVGGYLEFEDEIERLVVDSSLDLCLDTGHLAYAGMNPSRMLERHAARLAHVHFKDVRRDVLARVQAEHLTFWDAIAADVFCPVGEGVVDVADVIDTLHRIGYDGFATIEQDRVPGTGAALDEVRRSVAVLERAGLGR